MSDHLNELSSICGKENVLQGNENIDFYSVRGVRPSVVVKPGSVEEVSGIVRYCSSNELNISPAGNGTKLHMGNKPGKVDVVISTNRLNSFIEHHKKDFIATAQCGITLQEFQQELTDNQFLPLDPPHVNSGATLGGIIATNDYGPSRTRYGSCGEMLLEIKFVRADGKFVRGGARVVKNVAGYDIPRLLTGSLGTLGIMVESTFRLYPGPQYSRTIAASYPDSESLDAVIEGLMNSDIVPTAVEVTNPGLSGSLSGVRSRKDHDPGYNLYIKFDNTEKAVNDQLRVVGDLLGAGDDSVLSGSQETTLWDNITNFPYKRSAANMVLKASVLLRNVTRVFNYLNEIQDNLDLKIQCSGRICNGIVIISLEGETRNQIMAADLLRSHVSSFEGNVTVLKVPAELGEDIDIWGSFGSSINIMKKIKLNFDPKNILNPGRLIRDM